MNIYSILAIASGAVLGALLRWWLAVRWNAMFPEIPAGTLIANLLGCYLIGVAISFFSRNASVAPEWRLMVITGFLGALTTFSTFSAEVTTLLQRGLYIWAVAAIGMHLLGGLAMTSLGIVTIGFLSR